MEELVHTHDSQSNSSDFGDTKAALQEYFKKLDHLESHNEITFEQKLYYTDFLTKFAEFNLGKFMLKNKGLNGFWADYLINYPDEYKKLGHDPFGAIIKHTEELLLEHLPITVATQQRHKIFKKLSQKCIKDDITILSIPCGLASEVLQLDYSDVYNVKIYGVDIDPESLDIAKQRACKARIDHLCTWLQQDAWNFKLPEDDTDHLIDLIISNGLTMYINNDEQVYTLYKKFYQNLKTGGKLITSFITPPPYVDSSSTWNTAEIDSTYLELQQNIFSKIFNAKWHGYRTTEQTAKLLTQAGFKAENLKFHPDLNHIFPTVVAVK